MEATISQPQPEESLDDPKPTSYWSFEFDVSYSSGLKRTFRYGPTCPTAAEVWERIDAQTGHGAALVIKRIVVGPETFKELPFTRDYPSLCSYEEAIEYIDKSWKAAK